MITLIYTIAPEDKESELEWLNEQKIFPSIQESYDWAQDKQILMIGMIVNPESALLIKLRHKLQFQQEYRQR